MYRYLDQDTTRLDEPHKFVVAAMRRWVEAARAGRCACASLRPAFARQDATSAMGDFGIAMSTLDREGLAPLRFGGRATSRVTDDEARLLALFEAARAGTSPVRLRRIAATLVADAAADRLAMAMQFVAAHLDSGVIVERDR